jgi:hydrogenase maturation protease
MNIKVIGIGNRIMKDDGIGVRITEDIRKWLEEREMKVMIGETDSESCFYQIEEEDFLIIIDGTLFGIEPGTITVEALNRVKPAYKGYSQHNMSFIDLLYRYKKTNKGYLIGIEVGEIGFGIDLSEVLEQKYSLLLIEVKKIIEIIKEG